jgi:hypothetical protein
MVPGGVPIIEREKEMERRGEERRERDTSSPVNRPKLTLYFLSFSLLSVSSFLKVKKI